MQLYWSGLWLQRSQVRLPPLLHQALLTIWGSLPVVLVQPQIQLWHSVTHPTTFHEAKNHSTSQQNSKPYCAYLWCNKDSQPGCQKHINIGRAAGFAIYGRKRIAASLQNTATAMLLLAPCQRAVLRSPLTARLFGLWHNQTVVQGCPLTVLGSLAPGNQTVSGGRCEAEVGCEGRHMNPESWKMMTKRQETGRVGKMFVGYHRKKVCMSSCV